MDCLFCKIVDGSIPSNKVYEDDKVLVFLDINPNTNGHMLIISKEHIVTVDEVSSSLASHILEVEKKMHKLLTEKLDCSGLTIVQNNGLGQEVKHYHVHLIPRYKDDCWKMAFRQDNLLEISEVLKKINN